MKHPEPEHVRHYREIERNGPPRCCHTCERYGDDGVCDKFKSEPPEEFAATPDACKEWLMEVPF